MSRPIGPTEPSSIRNWPAQLYLRNECAEKGIANPVRVTPLPIGLSLQGEQSLQGEKIDEVWPFPEVTMVHGAYAGETVRLDYGHKILVIPDRSFLKAVGAYSPNLAQRTEDSKIGPTVAIVGGIAVLVVLLVIIGLWLARPYFEDAAARAVPLAIEAHLGEAAFNQYAPASKLCTAVPLNRALNQVLDRLVEASGNKDYHFRLAVVDDETRNALAAPGGYVVVFRGLLRITRNPSEFAGVLAHEVQHVLHRHSTKSIMRSVGMASVFAVLTGDFTGPLALAGHLGSLSFARGDEKQADEDGMRLLSKAGYSPQAIVDIYKRLDAASPGVPRQFTYLSTHPSGADRVNLLEEMAASSRDTAEPQSDTNWQTIAASCR